MQVLTFDGWCSQIMRPILQVQPLFLVLFTIFLAVGTYGLLNIVVGVIVETTMQRHGTS